MCCKTLLPACVFVVIVVVLERRACDSGDANLPSS